MRAAYLLLLGLIGISPALLVVDGPTVYAGLVAFAALALALVGASIRPGEAGHLASVIRPVSAIAAIPAIWLVVQMIPFSIKSWAHPVWQAAETALGAPIASGITIDPGATLVATCRYSSVIAILFVATVVTIERIRAERVLSWLVGLAMVAAVARIIHGLLVFEFLDQAAEVGFTMSTTAVCALGVVISAAAAVRALERYEAHQPQSDIPFGKFALAPVLALAAFSVCALSLVIFSSAPVSIAAASGLATLVILMVIRRLGFAPLAGDAVAAMAIGIVIAVAITIAETHAGTGNAMLRYASTSPSSLISMTQRMIADTGWPGTGGATFALLLPIYGNSNIGNVAMVAPSTAAQIVIELGWPALWAILIMTFVVLFLLLRGALQRGRDSFYPAAGAGCIVVLTLEAFCDASLFCTAVLVYATAALGLALAQRISRTAQSL
jgi:hypothetical protein